MTNDKSDIGQLFKDSFNEYEVHEPGGEWAAIEAKLSFGNFMHFGLFNFNVYYALLITGSIAINVILGINYFSPKQNENINNIIPSDSSMFINQQDSIIDKTKFEFKDEPKDKEIKSENSVYNQKKKIIEIEKSSNQKNATVDDVIVIDNPDPKTPEPENNNIKIDSLPNQADGIILSDSISNNKELDTVIHKPETPKEIIKKTITIKPEDIIERDTVVIYKKRKKSK